MHKLNPKDRMAIEMALRAGNKMHAIRLYMDAVPGSSMAEAKAEVESILTGIYVNEIAAHGRPIEETPHGSPLTSSNSIMVGISYIDRLQIAEAIFEGNKIEAVKIYRQVSGCKELLKAKKIIDLYEEELYKAFPKRFKKPPKHRRIDVNPFVAGVVIGILISLAIALYYFIKLWK